MVTTVITFILVLSFLVFIHELGHFLFFKRAGVLVHEFAIGFGPKLFSKVKGETLYSIRAIPFGGFVRIAGEDGGSLEFKKDAFVYATYNEHNQLKHLYLYEPTHVESVKVIGKVTRADLEKELFVVLEDAQGVETKYALDPQAMIYINKKSHIQIAPIDRQFGSKTLGQKAMAILAGPLFNIIFTILLFSILALRTGIDYQLKVHEVTPGKPASEVGIRVGDVVEEVNHKKIRPEHPFFSYQIMQSKGQEVELGILRDGQKITVPITPISAPADPKNSKAGTQYQIGIKLEPIKKNASLGQAFVEGCSKTYDWSVVTVDTLGKLLTGQLSYKNMSGPLMMGSATGKAAAQGTNQFIWFVALFGLNLGVFNLLPIPALDGGRLVFLGIQAIRRRPISPRKEGYVHLVGFAFLMLLMVVVTFNDIEKLFF